MYEVQTEKISMVAVATNNSDSSNKYSGILAIYASSHSVCLLLSIPTNQSISQHQTQLQSLQSATTFKSLIQVIAVNALPPSTSYTANNRPTGQANAQTFLDYLNPSFRMPRWHSRASTQAPQHVAMPTLLDSPLNQQGTLLFFALGSNRIILLHLNQGKSSANNNTKQLTANSTAQSISKQANSTIGELEYIQFPVELERVLCLSEDRWMFETIQGEKYTSKGKSTNFQLELINSVNSVETQINTVNLSPILHDQAWSVQAQTAASNSTASLKPNSLRKRLKPPPQFTEGVFLDSLDAETSNSAAPSAAEALFIPRQSNSNISAEIPAHSFLVPARSDSLFQFAVGSLFHSNSAQSSGENRSTLYSIEIPAPLDRAIQYNYHTSLAAYAPQSKQIIIPTYLSSINNQTNLGIEGFDALGLSIINISNNSIRFVRIHLELTAESAENQPPLTMDRFNSYNQRYLNTEANLEGSKQPKSLYSQANKRPANLLNWSRDRIIALQALSSGDLAVIHASGRLRLLEISEIQLNSSAAAWKRLFGIQEQLSPIMLEKASDKKGSSAEGPKHGEFDGKKHTGGSSFKGGSGGVNTAGLGGAGGPYRHQVIGGEIAQMSAQEKENVSAEIKKAAREMGHKELAKRLNEIDLSAGDNSLYQQYYSKVSKQIAQLQLILNQAEAKNVEREWLKAQLQGDLDDNKIVDALTGEKNIYRRRGVANQQLGAPQQQPKRLLFVLDISGSMFRFNQQDQRLERCLELALLIMEAFHGLDQKKFSYSVVGHSGDGAEIKLIEWNKPPKNRAEKLKVLQRMYAHSQYCSSGDHTLEAIHSAINDVTAVEGDDYFVLIISDANLSRYGISAQSIGQALSKDVRVNAAIIFLASLLDEANRLIKQLPVGKAFFLQDSAVLPNLFKAILDAAALVNE
jgi:hypothetical protein